MAGQGVATGKISLAVELIDNYKQIASQLKNGLKGNLKDYELDVGFNDETLAKQAEEELGKINKLLTDSRFKGLDWSNVIPPLTQVLGDNSLAEDIKVQIIEGFRRGIEQVPYYYSQFFTKNGKHWEKIKPGEEIAQQVLQSSIFEEAIDYLGMGKQDTKNFKKQYKDALSQSATDPNKNIKEIIQMMTNVSIADEFRDVMPYMLGRDTTYKTLEDILGDVRQNPQKNSENNIRKALGLKERFEYLRKQNPNVFNAEDLIAVEKMIDEILSTATDKNGNKYSQEQIQNIIGNITERVRAASEARDKVRQDLNSQQYTHKDIPELLNRLRDMVHAERSKQVQSVLEQYSKSGGLDLDKIFNMIAPDEEPVDLRYDNTVTDWLSSFVERVTDERSEEKKQRDEKARKNAQISQAFRNLFKLYGKTGVDASTENIEGLVDPASFTEKLEGDVDHLKEQRQEVENQAKELQNAKEELEKENVAIANAIEGKYSKNGSNASKQQLKEKQEAYDKADESNKDLAWVEYYKAYQNMIKDGNMPQKLGKTWNGKSLAERLAEDFGNDKEFNDTNFREHIINLKQKWIENSTALQDLLKTIAESEAQKKAIDEQISNIQTESKPAATVPEVMSDDQNELDIEQLEQQRKALEEELKTLENQRKEQEKLNSAIQDVIDSINEGELETRNRSEAETVLEQMYESDNDDIRDLARYWETSGETGASFGALESYGEDVQAELANLEEQIEARKDKIKEINESIKQMSSTPIETEEPDMPADGEEELSGDEKLKNLLENKIKRYTEEQKELQDLYNEINKIINDKDNFNPEALINHENEQIATWVNNLKNNGKDINIEALEEYNRSLEAEILDYKERIEKNQAILNNVNNRINGAQSSDNAPAQPVREQADANEALGESAGQATGAVNGLTEAQRQSAQTGQQASETAQNGANALREEENAARDDAEAQRELAAQRQNANNARTPSTPANPTPASTPEAPPTHPETPVNTGTVKGMKEEKDNADELTFKFISAAEAKQAFVDANKEVKASADASAKSMEEESKAALKAKFGFDPEELQNTINTTQQIQSLLTQVSTAISQMDNNSNTTGIVDQLTKVAEAMGLIVKSAQQVDNAMSAIQAEGGLKVELQNGLDIKPLITQFDALNKKVLALVTSLANVQSAIGAIDDNSGVPNLLSQIQTIASSLETISQKDLGVNFNISNNGNTIQQQAAKDREALKELRSQAETLGNYFANNLGKDWEGMLKREGGDNYFKTLWSTQDVLDDKKSTNEEKMEAYKRRIADLKQYAIEAGAAIESILPKDTKTPEKIIDDAKNFALKNTPIEQLKSIFGGNTNAVLNDILSEIQNITSALNSMGSTLSSLSDGSKLTGLKEVFEQIPQKIGEATQKILELRQQIDTAQFSAGFDEQFKGLTEQLEAAKEQTKATNEELAKTKKLLDEEAKARKQLQSDIDKYKKQDVNDQQKASAEEKKALQAEKKNLEQQLAKEKQNNENRVKAIEQQNKTYLKEELERKKAIELEQMRAAEREKKAQQAAVKAAEKAQINKEDTSLSTDYKRLSDDYKEIYNATTIEQYNTALQHVLETEERIRLAREQSVIAHGTSEQIMQQATGLSDGTLEGSFVEGFEKTKQAQLDAMRAIETQQTAFADKQQASVDSFVDKMQTINTKISPEVVSGWGDVQQAEYQKVIEGANLASIAVESLNRIIGEMRSGQFDFTDQNAVGVFLELKNALPGIINDAQSAEKSIIASADKSTKDVVSQLDTIEKNLTDIKDKSGNLLNIDDGLQGKLQEAETHLAKIKSLKEEVNKDPLKILNTDFSNSLQDYLKQMSGGEDQAGFVKEIQAQFNDSQARFNKIPTSYNRYATAINTLLTDITKNSNNISLEKLKKELKEIVRIANNLSQVTGLKTSELLTGEMTRSTSQIDEAQAAALSKVSIGYEKIFSTIRNRTKDAQTTIQNIFGEGGIKDFDSLFSMGKESNSSRFKAFSSDVSLLTKSLSELQAEQEKFKDGDFTQYIAQEGNLEKIWVLLNNIKDAQKGVNEGAKKFSIVDKDTLIKYRADIQQFLRANPALTGAQTSDLRNIYNQLQEGINSVDASNLIAQFENVKKSAIDAGNTGGTFISMLTERFKSLGAYLLSFVSFYRVIGVFKDGINIIHELDDALTEMQKVSDESLSSLKEYQKTTFDTANNIGTTAQQLQVSTADWMRLGEGLQEASQSAQTANVLFNVSEFESIDEATTALVAMSAAYADAEKDIDKMDIVDRLNLIGNNYAIATDELATALQDGAATLQTAGNDLDQAIALTTAGNLITQDASKTGK